MTGGNLVIVSGPPASGKSTIAAQLAKDLGLPIISKDRLKEVLFDNLGWESEELRRRLNLLSWDLLFEVLEVSLASDASVIADGNFEPEFHEQRVERLSALTGCRVVQVVCQATNGVRLTRSLARKDDRERHPGHIADRWVPPDLTPAGQSQYREWQTLDVQGTVFRVETSDSDAASYDELLTKVRKALQR